MKKYKNIIGSGYTLAKGLSIKETYFTTAGFDLFMSEMLLVLVLDCFIFSDTYSTFFFKV